MLPDGRAPAEMLRLEGVSRDFVGLRAVDRVSLRLARGEILGLIGPNGSGKTTLINVVTGFLRPTEGRIFLDGLEITGWPAHRVSRAGVARTFQSIRLFRGLTVLENVEVAAVSHGATRREAREEARALLDTLGLLPLADHPAGALPYGQERRLEIARALAARPSFLLLDEPAAGMTETESDDLLRILARLPEAYGCGLLVVEHDMRLIMRLCHRVHVLNHGQTIAEGPPEAVRRDPAVIEAYLGRSRGGHAPS